MSLTKRQLEARKSMITGSDAGTILGVNPYGSRYRTWAIKVGEYVDDFKGNNKTDLGTWLERFAVWKYEQTTGSTCRKVLRTLYHKRYKFMGGHIDRLIVGDKNRGLECKVVTPDGMAKWLDDDGEIQVPLYYRAQTLHYAVITGRMIWDFSVVFTDGRRDPAIITIEFTKLEMENYLVQCIDFWRLNVETKTPPPVDGSKATTEALKYQWQETDIGSIKVATKEVLQYFTNRFQHKHFRDIAQGQMDLAENRIVNFMQDAETLVAPGGETIFTLKPDKNGKRRKNFNYIIEAKDDRKIAV